MGKPNFDVYGIGQCCLDHLGKAPAYPPPDVKCEFTGLVIEGGGPVATALVALARWGIPCTFAGTVGDDEFGEKILASFRKEGIDTSGVLVRKHAGSQFAFVLAEPGLARRTIFWRRATGTPPQPEELRHDVIGQSKVLHTDAFFPEASLAACRTAKEAGVAIVVDAGSLREGMLEHARLAEHFLASGFFARAFLERDDPVEACRKLAEYGPRVVAVTRGKEGYVALVEGELIDRPACPAEAVDTTGCGDVFHAGYTYGLLQDWPVEERLDFAAWAASRVSLKMGGREGIPTRRELQRYRDQRFV